MNEERPSPPRELKPWYYQDWFLFPMFIFWPLWAVLILRSPWHNGFISGAIAWAMLIAGSFLVAQRLRLGGTVAESTLIFIIPGPGWSGTTISPSLMAGVSSYSRKVQGIYSTVSPLGMAAMLCTWISGIRWLTTGRLKASAMPATLRNWVMPPTRSKSIITMSTERCSSM